MILESNLAEPWVVRLMWIVIGGLVTIMVGIYMQGRSARAKMVEDNQKKFADMDKQLAVLTTQVTPFWAAMQAKLSADLHHPHARYKEMDALLEKLEALTIQPDERLRLNELLEARAKDMHKDITDTQRSSARIMLEIMPLVLEERANPEPITDVGMVGKKSVAKPSEHD